MNASKMERDDANDTAEPPLKKCKTSSTSAKNAGRQLSIKINSTMYKPSEKPINHDYVHVDQLYSYSRPIWQPPILDKPMMYHRSFGTRQQQEHVSLDDGSSDDSFDTQAEHVQRIQQQSVTISHIHTAPHIHHTTRKLPVTVKVLKPLIAVATMPMRASSASAEAIASTGTVSSTQEELSALQKSFMKDPELASVPFSERERLSLMKISLLYIKCCIAVLRPNSSTFPKLNELHRWLDSKRHPPLTRADIRLARRALKEPYNILLHSNANKLTEKYNTLYQAQEAMKNIFETSKAKAIAKYPKPSETKKDATNCTVNASTTAQAAQPVPQK